MRNRSPTRTSRAAFAICPLDKILPSSQARFASGRVLKNLAAHSQMSIRTPVMNLFSYKDSGKHETRNERSDRPPRSADSAAGRSRKPSYPRPARTAIPDGSESSCQSSDTMRSEEHTSELQSLRHLVCRLLLE